MKKLSNKIIGFLTLSAISGTTCYGFGLGEWLSQEGVPLKVGSAMGLWATLLIAIGATAALVMGMLVALALKNRKHRCQFCKSQMKVSGCEVTEISRTARLHSTVYTCPGCDNVRTRTRKLTSRGNLSDTPPPKQQNGYARNNEQDQEQHPR